MFQCGFQFIWHFCIRFEERFSQQLSQHQQFVELEQLFPQFSPQQLEPQLGLQQLFQLGQFFQSHSQQFGFIFEHDLQFFQPQQFFLLPQFFLQFFQLVQLSILP